jgi:predicted nuclease of restriction endonuclease-like (RecB) superfamily
MRSFAKAYPDFPIVQVPLAQITWYHHISLLSKVKEQETRAFYIAETARNGWSRDVMLLQISNGYMQAKGKAINNFDKTLPPAQSDLARSTFKDPYKPL